MLINEVCTITGLTKKAILYYEKQGLISSEKGNNGYRNYSVEDITRISLCTIFK